MPSIILLDDEPSEIHLMARALRERLGDCTIHECWTLNDAREVLKNETVDLIVSDHLLPDGEGISLLYELEHMPLRPVFLMMTGYGDESLAAKALSHGADSYIIKSIDGRHRQLVANQTADFLDNERNTIQEHKAWRFQLPTTHPQLPSIILDKEGKISTCTEGFEKLIGGSLERFVDARFLDCLSEITSEESLTALNTIYSKGLTRDLVKRNLSFDKGNQCKALLRRLDGGVTDIQFRIHPFASNNYAIGHMVVVMPADEIERWKYKLTEAGQADGLTGLQSRHRVNSEWEMTDKVRSIVLLEVANLIDINEASGIEDGNTLLQGVGKALKRSAPKQAVCARWSGNQFLVIAEDSELEPVAIEDIVTKAKKNLPVTVGDNEVKFRVASTALAPNTPALAPHIVALRQKLAPL